MKLTELHDEWAIDAEIDKSNLDEVARNVPKLHARWMRHYSEERSLYRKLKAQQQVLRRDKFEWFRNSITEERRTELGWAEPQAKRIDRSDVDMYLNADAEMQTLVQQIDLQETKLKFIEDVIKQINNRNFLLKTMVEYLRFTQGQ